MVALPGNDDTPSASTAGCSHEWISSDAKDCDATLQSDKSASDGSTGDITSDGKYIIVIVMYKILYIL